MKQFFNQVHFLLDLRVDTNYEGTDESIRQNVNFKSANAWTLVFAIFIASVGLNVNSTAVIIGAMLISPLMGPIVGAGYALGINDFILLKTSGKNLMYAVCISLVTSTAYFMISPFTDVQNELLARTAPNFYDVVIAVFGGAAGIVAMSRSEKSNAIPGVAIATALMPPLCTAGFGIATLDWKFFVGALYLFVINSVFIGLSTYVFVRYLKFKQVHYSTESEQRRIHRWLVGTALVVVIPSLVTAWILLAQSAFRNKANKFVDSEVKFKTAVLVDKKFIFDLKSSIVRLTFIGSKLTEETLRNLEKRLVYYGLESVKLEIDQVAIDDHINSHISQRADGELPYKQRISELELVLKAMKDERAVTQSLLLEVQTFSPKISGLFTSDGAVQVIWKQKPKTSERKAIEDFLKIRMKKEMMFTHSFLL